MKKTLLSVLAGLTVVGSASAAPTPEDRKALCDLLIQKGTHVWVEKTQACVPVDPCNDQNPVDIRTTYCIGQIFLPNEQRAIDLFFERYAENVLKTQIADINKSNEQLITITTKDRGYYAAYNFTPDKCLQRTVTVTKAYGQRYKDMSANSDVWKPGVVLYMPNVKDKTMCEDIKDFANLLYATTDTDMIFDEEYGCVANCQKK